MGKIIIFGLDDLLTFQISKTLTEESESTVIAITPSKESKEYECDKSFIIDFENNKDFAELMNENSPDVIINTMIISDDDDSISSNHKMYFDYLDNLLNFAIKSDAHFIHFSTARVFSGEKGNYSEIDIADSTDKLGLKMIEAERMISQKYNKFTIIRFSDIFGGNDYYSDFVNAFLEDNENKETTKYVDYTFNPLFVNDLASALYFIIEYIKTGIYHFGSKDKVKLSTILMKAAEMLECEEITTKFDDSDLDFSMSVFKTESEQIYKFSNVDSYLVTMKHFENMSNKFYNVRK